MKKVAIFDDCIDNGNELEKRINQWIEENKINIVSIDVKPHIIGYVEKTYNGEKSVDNTVDWIATVVYDDNKKENFSVGDNDNAVHFVYFKDFQPCSECGELTDIEVFESNDSSVGGQRRICAKCLRNKFLG